MSCLHKGLLENLYSSYFLIGSSGTIQFAELEPHFYTIRIVAENGRDDRGTLRVRVRVPVSSSHCGVNLINKQWVQEGANVTLWFETFGPVDTVKCQANSREETCKYMHMHALHEEIGTHTHTHTPYITL